MNRSPRWIAAAALAAALAACNDARTPEQPPQEGLQFILERATLNPERKVAIEYRLLDAEGAARGAEGVVTRFSVAYMSPDPADDPEVVPSWVSVTRSTRPGLAPDVAAQPNFEQGAGEALGDGRFRYTTAAVVPPEAGATTVRVGAWSQLATGGAVPTRTLDFTTGANATAAREVVNEENCNTCHVQIAAHEGRAGVRVCQTCHTFQLRDPDTGDPANRGEANRLDLGSLTHRIHRGKNLPTIRRVEAAARAVPPVAGAPDVAGQDAILNGPYSRYLIAGFFGLERPFVFGEATSRTDTNPVTGAQTRQIVRAGVGFPQDIRNCDACHGGAAQGTQKFTAISPRTCQGCHTDIWMTSAAPDAFHVLHPGLDGTPNVGLPGGGCTTCHAPEAPAFAGAAAQNRMPVAHVPPLSEGSPLQFTIVDVQGAAPGANPTIIFEVREAGGATPGAGITDLNTLNRFEAVLSGPAQEYLFTRYFLSQNARAATPVPGAAGRYTYTFANRADGTPAIPADFRGTMAFSLEGRRVNTALQARERAYETELTGVPSTLNFYDLARNPVVYRPVGEGVTEQARRTVVATDSCNRCHFQFNIHGGNRTETQYCVFCHAPDATDWGNGIPTGTPGAAGRPRVADAQTRVDVAATADGQEERSIHLKHMIHRIHTGEAMVEAGAPDLPYVIYGFGRGPNFFDEILVPQAARMRCTSCHVEDPARGVAETWLLEAIPSFALPSVSNESTFLANPLGAPPAPIHDGVPVHDPSGGTEPKQNPMMSACVSCHTSPFALSHARAESPAPGQERCLLCHGEGQIAPVRAVHAAAAGE